jgi:hypothetical protein
MAIARTWIVAAISAVAFASLAQAQDLNPKNRQELKRADLTGTNMEVIISVVENEPGETIPRHNPSRRGGILRAARCNGRDIGRETDQPARRNSRHQ